MKKAVNIVGHGFLGLLEGAIVSIMPLPLNFAFILLFIILWPLSLIRSRSRTEKEGHLIKIAVGVVAVTVAVLVPIKVLDTRVGPMEYRDMTLSAVADALDRDWKVPHPRLSLEQSASEAIITFRTDRKMSKRQVLQQLARQTGHELRIRYCGVAANFLFGAYPMSITLEPQKAQPRGGRGVSP